jgi:dolichol-phosphate mannosyltransferase
VGAAGAVLQVAIFTFVVRWLPAAGAAALAVELVVLHNFLWHERFTWRDRAGAGLRQRTMRLWRFNATNGIVSIAGNTAVVWLLSRFGAPPLAAQAAAIAVCAPVNFWIADRWVYGRRRCGDATAGRTCPAPTGEARALEGA